MEIQDFLIIKEDISDKKLEKGVKSAHKKFTRETLSKFLLDDLLLNKNKINFDEFREGYIKKIFYLDLNHETLFYLEISKSENEEFSVYFYFPEQIDKCEFNLLSIYLNIFLIN